MYCTSCILICCVWIFTQFKIVSNFCIISSFIHGLFGSIIWYPNIWRYPRYFSYWFLIFYGTYFAYSAYFACFSIDWDLFCLLHMVCSWSIFHVCLNNTVVLSFYQLLTDVKISNCKYGVFSLSNFIVFLFMYFEALHKYFCYDPFIFLKCLFILGSIPCSKIFSSIINIATPAFFT